MYSNHFFPTLPLSGAAAAGRNSGKGSSDAITGCLRSGTNILSKKLYLHFSLYLLTRRISPGDACWSS